jgi:hypothetical protein
MGVMGDIEGDAKRAAGWVTGHLHHPASAAPAAATSQQSQTSQPEEHMSLLDEAENLYADAKAKLGEFETALPNALADAKKLEGSPIAQVAITAAEHLASGVLGTEEVNLIASSAKALLDGIVVTYHNAQSTVASAEQTAAAGAQAVSQAGSAAAAAVRTGLTPPRPAAQSVPTAANL